MALMLRWLGRTTLPVDAAGLDPGALAGLSTAEVARRGVRVGNTAVNVGELFAVSEGADGPSDDALTVEGDLTHVRNLGRGMTGGVLTVRGDAGPHLGAGMTGGVIEVHGRAGDWAGAEMRGGMLRVHGDAGHAPGAAYPGSRLGMRDGVILVDGSVGDDAGRRMRRGLIAVRGGAGDGFGSNLVAGTLVALGPVGRYPGAGMKRGTVALLHESVPRLLPSFVSSGRYRFPFLTVYLRQLAAWGFEVSGRVSQVALERYNGDVAEGGRGEILVAAGPDER
jgi:formylmethanofuran dehydrogenase subunit C